MKRYAVYRCLYGEDFVQQSINSITNYVDKIFIFWDDTPWGDSTECMYKGELIQFPKKFDNILDKIKELNNPKIELIYDHQFNNINQFTYFVNDLILPNYDRPDMIIIPEVDHIIEPTDLEKALNEMKHRNLICGTTKQVELWRYFNYYVPKRCRSSTAFWDMNKIEKLPKTHRQADPTNLGISEDKFLKLELLDAWTHNVGFCCSPKVMYWKHLTALAFSRKIQEDMPNVDWYEDIWLKWDYHKNNKNVEISKGYEHNISYIEKYDIEKLPKILRKTIK